MRLASAYLLGAGLLAGPVPAPITIAGWSSGARSVMRVALSYPDAFHAAILNSGTDPFGNAGIAVPPNSFHRRSVRLGLFGKFRDRRLAHLAVWIGLAILADGIACRFAHSSGHRQHGVGDRLGGGIGGCARPGLFGVLIESRLATFVGALRRIAAGG